MSASRLLGAVLGATLLITSTASATFPGTNGDLVVSAAPGGECDAGVELYTVAPTGGTPVRLTHVCTPGEHPAPFVAAPEAAPDGRSVLAFTRDGPATVSLDGETITPIAYSGGRYDQDVSENELSYLPDGESFVSSDPYEGGVLQRVFLDGSPAQVLFPSGGEVRDPRYAPDGSAILALVYPYGTLRHRLSGDGLRLLHPDDSSFGPIIARTGTEADWSPDSQRIVYVGRRRYGGKRVWALFVRDRDGAHRRRLVVDRHRPIAQPVWSPDGKSIAWVTNRGGYATQRYTVWTKDADGQAHRHKLAELPKAIGDEGYFHSPEMTWLPGGA